MPTKEAIVEITTSITRIINSALTCSFSAIIGIKVIEKTKLAAMNNKTINGRYFKIFSDFFII